jgi:hypothetical protein
MTAPPGKGSSILVFWPTLMPASDFTQTVTLEDRSWVVPLTMGAAGASEDPFGGAAVARGDDPPYPPAVRPVKTENTGRALPIPALDGSTVRLPLGTLLGARSGDKAGNATLGVWARDDAAHQWLRSWWTEPRLRELLPETTGLELRLWEFPLLRACGVTVVGLLGAGVAANHALDGQAKALGEYLRAKVADIPADLLNQASQR